MRDASAMNLRDDSDGDDNSVVFRRRESTLSARSGAVNDRSSYEARTVWGLDALSAIGSIINARDGVCRFFHDQHVREVWISALESAFLKRRFDRLLEFYPTAGEVSEYLEAQAASTRNQGRGTPSTPIESATNADPYLELVHYAMFELLSNNSRARMINTRRGLDLLKDTKECALQMLLTWITQSNQPENSPRAELESVLLAHEDRPGVNKSVRSFQKMICREMRSLREFVTKFVSEIAERASTIPGGSHSCSVSQSHIPETFLCDDCALPPSVKRAFLDEIELLLDPNNDVTGTLVDLIDPSLNCRSLDNKTRHHREFADATCNSDGPEVFSAFGHGGQSSSSRLSKSLLSSGESPGFQWLPLDLMVHSADGFRVSIESEINSIHPMAFPAIHTGMGHLVAKFVPLFERVLSSIATAKPPAPTFQRANAVHDPRILPVPMREVVEHASETALMSQGTTGTSEERNKADESSFLSEAASQEDWRKYCFDHDIPVRPRFDRNLTSPSAHTELRPFSLRGRRIQVIPKLSTIRLTPEHLKFSDHGSRKWQIDGDSNEQLVAIGYHVLEYENISAPEISFRAFAHAPPSKFPSAVMAAPPNCECAARDEFLAFGEKVAGYHEGRYGHKFLQPWGSMALLANRKFAVPAFLAHRLEPFELLDPKTSGRLTLLTLYLVDPTQKIASTATLRPEEHDRRWVEANINMLRDLPWTPPLLPSSLAGQAHERSEKLAFPDEIAQNVVDFAANEALGAQNAVRRRRKYQLENERARRHEIRFLHHKLALEPLQIALPAVQ